MVGIVWRLISRFTQRTRNLRVGGNVNAQYTVSWVTTLKTPDLWRSRLSIFGGRSLRGKRRWKQPTDNYASHWTSVHNFYLRKNSLYSDLSTYLVSGWGRGVFANITWLHTHYLVEEHISVTFKPQIDINVNRNKIRWRLSTMSLRSHL